MYLDNSPHIEAELVIAYSEKKKNLQITIEYTGSKINIFDKSENILSRKLIESYTENIEYDFMGDNRLIFSVNMIHK